LKARGRASKAAQVAAPSKEATATQGPASKDLADFSNEYSGLKLSLKVEGLGDVEGRLLKASRYWFKLMTSGGVIYVNKAYVMAVKPLELTPPAQEAAQGLDDFRRINPRPSASVASPSHFCPTFLMFSGIVSESTQKR